MLKVLVSKTFFISFKRFRIPSLFIGSLVLMAIQIVVWELMKDSVEEAVFALIFRAVAPSLLVFSQASILSGLVNEIISEKETKMKIIQLTSGVPAWIYWTSYMMYYMALASVLAAAWTVVLCLTSMKGANPLLVFFEMEATYMQTFGTAVLFSTLFDKLKTAASFVQVTVYVMWIPIGISNVPNLPYLAHYVTGFVPGFALIWWMQSVTTQGIVAPGNAWNWGDDFALELTKSQLSAVGLEEHAVPPAGYLWALSFLQVGLWLAFAYWFDQVWQGEHGSAKPLTFCFQPRYLCPRRVAPAAGGEASLGSSATRPLLIKNMTKTFARGKTTHTAVDDMSLDVRSAELFALLGHNGAGKTTVINCITGMTPITSGEAMVMGHSSINDIDRCRWNLAICPQDNPMYDEFTVAQHLRFFAALRGSSDHDQEIPHILALLGLQEKLQEQCKKLSGGQKRRLWVATSLLGDAPVVFLDEPTSGMDPASRRQLWNLLLDMKSRGRSILFTTHYLEEADVLADRKAVLAKGKVKAAGTSMELKRQFGVGYHLKVLLQRSASPSCAEKVRDLVKQMVRSSTPRLVPGEERAQSRDALAALEFDLPYAEMDSFGPLLKALEDSQGALCIEDVDISMTSLEEVFMALGREAAKEEAAKEGATGRRPESPALPDSGGLELQDLEAEPAAPECLERPPFWEQVGILFRLRVELAKANKKIAIGTVVYPLVFLPYMYVSCTGFGKNWGYSMSSGFGFAPSLCVAMAGSPVVSILVHERESKVRHAMISQGMHPMAYWAGTILEVGGQVLLVSLAVPTFAHAFSQDFMRHGLSVFVWLAAVLQPVPLLLAYCNYSRLFSSVEVATKTLTFLVLLASGLPLVPWAIWKFAPTGKGNWDMIGNLVHTGVSFVSPSYLLSGVITAAWRAGGAAENAHSMRYPTPANASFGTWLDDWIIWAPFVGQLVLSLVLGYELYRSSTRSKAFTIARVEDEDPLMIRDDDVVAETAKVETAAPSEHACLYRNLEHSFCGHRGEPVRAVRGISLAIDKGECFGLLGPNGAGKTTTLGCLTGEIRPPTNGEVFVAGHAVTGAGVFEAYKSLGFCPQVDPVIPGLTGRQHLALYARTKGVPAALAEAEANGILGRLGFEEADRNKDASKYSGGMKRKLSLAQALIGSSSVLFLDEPSAAVDAGAKRLLWRVIKLRRSCQTVVITTHSMEEAEAVCDRIGIQVKGRLRCLGSPDHLKAKHGSGYQLELILKPIGGQSTSFCEASATASERKVTEFVHSELSSEGRLLEAHGLRFLYQLPSLRRGGLTLGDVFTKLQAARTALGIEDYSIARASLEQVFLKFAREQEDGEP
jgi:ATP-binding cassette subfamily A (ABC1) protein 3